METRNSHGLEQFCASLRERSEVEGADPLSLSVLDLAGVNQATVTFITGLGHRLYSDDILRTLDEFYPPGGSAQNDPQQLARFLEQSLDFPEDHFDGALVWDTLQFLPPAVLQVAVDRLHRVLRPQAHLLALFHAEEQNDTMQTYSYRIADSRTILLSPRSSARRAVQHFNNRSLEKLFQDFGSVKFFLTRDHLREVIVKR